MGEASRSRTVPPAGGSALSRRVGLQPIAAWERAGFGCNGTPPRGALGRQGGVGQGVDGVDRASQRRPRKREWLMRRLICRLSKVQFLPSVLT